MYIIAGLGNPGKEYAHTRHNAGFDTIDILADKNNINIDTMKFKGLMGKGIIAGQTVILLKPFTYMNLSGESIREAVDYYKADPASELIVIYDDIYLAPGNIRIRNKGSAGGHNGMKNIIKHLGTEDFPRVRIGVGEKPKEYELKDYVLGHFSDKDKEAVQDGMIRAVNAIEKMLVKDIESVMSEYNRKRKDNYEDPAVSAGGNG
ncbi:MAG: aminoacyl-tRNA hydrolase [Lachnospiraceae bacterium]|nr:aminoacyl-tRNA hydrolase [Lachnospiraceae bacterium]